MIAVADIARRLNQCADSLAPELLPNGRKAGNLWRFSGIGDTGGSFSAWVNLAGPLTGQWRDEGNARAGEERGDMLDLVRLKRCHGDKAEAVQWAKSRLGIEDDFKPGKRAEPTREERERAAADARERAEAREAGWAEERALKARRAKALFLSGGPIAGTPVEHYLAGRGIVPIVAASQGTFPGSLRYHAEVWCKPVRCKVPAMLAGIFTAAGAQIGTHRTFLELDRKKGWTKITLPDGEAAKRVLGNVKGGFIPIHKGAGGKSMRAMPQGEPVYVTEGIEDALCVRMMQPAKRIICGISLGNIGEIVLPEQARELVIVADRDDNPRAQDMLERSIARQQARGIRVALVMPPAGIKDINDWLLELERQRAQAAGGSATRNQGRAA
jgi:hypothetical protein